VKQWHPAKPIEGAIYVETIPIKETRHYVQKVMANTCFYSGRFGTKSMSLKQRLGMVVGLSNLPTLASDKLAGDKAGGDKLLSDTVPSD
jgi:soluble lytic murein transglycosylase